ncbi:MAG: aldo/keto reductase, partial [Solirubrobacterales bacterium]|nr:aldo/keto reductase [Solirubrobacterales bacterium]
MKTRTLGPNGPTVSALGLGCMGMSAFYGARDDEESLKTLNRALELGVSFWDTSDMYGPHTNERLLARVLDGRRDEVYLATKFGIKLDPADPRKRSIDGTPADDYRRFSPRFEGENFEKNLTVVDAVKDLADDKGVTPSQLALAWVMAQGEHVVPIPGTKRVRYLEENAAAAEIELAPE